MQMRNRLALLVIAVVLLAALTSCRPAHTPSPSEPSGHVEHLNPEGQVVTFWYRSRSHEEALLALIDEFNATNEWNIVVRAEYAGDSLAIHDRILSGIAADRVPDLSLADADQAAVYAAQGALVDLTPYIQSEKWGFDRLEREDLFPFVLQAALLPGLQGRYIFPFDRSMDVLYYNKDWLNELGYDQPPYTWEEFEGMACAAANAEAGTYGYEFSVDAATFVAMLANRGGRMLAEDAAAYTFGDERGLETLTFLQGLLDSGCATREQRWAGDEADFAAGRVLFIIDSTSLLASYHRAVAAGAGFKWSVAAMPTTLDAPTMGIQRDGLLLFRSSPERQLAAWLFVRWLGEPQQQAIWAQASGRLPVRASTEELLQEDFAANPPYATAFAFLHHDIAAEPGVAGYDVCRRRIEEMLTAVAGGADPAEQLEQAVQVCNTSLGAAPSSGR